VAELCHIGHGTSVNVSAYWRLSDYRPIVDDRPLRPIATTNHNPHPKLNPNPNPNNPNTNQDPNKSPANDAGFEF